MVTGDPSTAGGVRAAEARRGRRVRLLAWLRAAISVVVLTGCYFLTPLRHTDLAGTEFVVRALGLCVGLTLLTWLVARQVRRALRPGRMLSEQVSVLLTLVTGVVVFFSALYYLLVSQFSGIHTRMDALYFSVVTLATVGYGDITPVGQTARVLVTVQILFDLVIVTTAISLVVTAPREHVA